MESAGRIRISVAVLRRFVTVHKEELKGLPANNNYFIYCTYCIQTERTYTVSTVPRNTVTKRHTHTDERVIYASR